MPNTTNTRPIDRTQERRRIGDIVLGRTDQAAGADWEIAIVTAYDNDFIHNGTGIVFQPDEQGLQILSELETQGYKRWCQTADELASIKPLSPQPESWLERAYPSDLADRQVRCSADRLSVIYRYLRETTPDRIVAHRTAETGRDRSVLHVIVPRHVVGETWPKPDSDRMYSYFDATGYRSDFVDRESEHFRVTVDEPRPGWIAVFHDGYHTVKQFRKQKLYLTSPGGRTLVQFQEFIPNIDFARDVREQLLPRAYDVLTSRTGVAVNHENEEAIDEWLELIAQITGYGKITVHQLDPPAEIVDAILQSIGAVPVPGTCSTHDGNFAGYCATPEQTKRFLLLTPEQQQRELTRMIRRAERDFNEKRQREDPEIQALLRKFDHDIRRSDE